MSLLFAAASAAGAKNQTGPLIFLIAICVVMVIIPLVAFWLVARTKAKAKAAEAWPTAAGTVSDTSVQVSRTRSGGPIAGTGTRTNWYSPKIFYDFQVGGKPFTGKRMRFGWPYFGKQADAVAALEGHEKGGPVQVRYNPANPSDNAVTTIADVFWIKVLGWSFVAIDVLFGAVAILALTKT